MNPPSPGWKISTGLRLHFGLLSWGGPDLRRFGGLGLMVEGPGLVASLASGEGRVLGPLAGRAVEIVERIRATGFQTPPFDLTIESAPPEHAGLGTGTQLSLAIGRLMAAFAGQDLNSTALAKMTGRGRRSGVGLHGFDLGGLVVDGGHRGVDSESFGVPPLLTRLAFPSEWSVLVVIPDGPPGLHGGGERGAFSRLPPPTSETVDRLCRLVLLGVLPSVVERDLNAFGAALEEIQARVGEAFAPAQCGGAFARPESVEIVQFLREFGLVGVGQSSWGPTLYGFSDDPSDEIPSVLRRRFGIEPGRVFWTKAMASGARLERLDPLMA